MGLDPLGSGRRTVMITYSPTAWVYQFDTGLTSTSDMHNFISVGLVLLIVVGK